jgi:hypothetical protein
MPKKPLLVTATKTLQMLVAERWQRPHTAYVIPLLTAKHRQAANVSQARDPNTLAVNDDGRSRRQEYDKPMLSFVQAAGKQVDKIRFRPRPRVGRAFMLRTLQTRAKGV